MDLRIGTIRGRFASNDFGKIWLSIPSEYIVGSDVRGMIYNKSNGELTPFTTDLNELVLELLEHETIHFVIEELIGRFVSACLDKTKYALDEANKINKLNKGI